MGDRAVVFDIGSAGLKYGFAGEDSPRGASMSLYGVMPEHLVASVGKEYFRTSDITPDLTRLKMQYGYWGGKQDEFGLVCESYMKALRDLLGNDFEDRTFVISEPVGTSQIDRQLLMEAMFDSFSARSLCIVPQPTLALYSTGRTTGFVLESGHGTTQFSPIYEGCPLEPGSVRIEFGGFDVSSSFERMFRRTHDKYSHVTLAARYLVDKTFDNLKIEHAYVAKDLEEKPEKTEFKDAHGDVWTLESERTRCAEILFDPKLAEKDFEGVDKIAFDTIEKCSSELRRDLWSNFVVSGGNTLLKGFCERLESSLRRRSDTPDDIHIICPEDRVKSVWRGGSLLATSPHFDQMCVTRECFNEWGPDIVSRAFF